MKRIIPLTLIALLLLPHTLFALEPTTIPDGLTLCEYYVQPTDTLVYVTSELSEVSQGSSAVFTGMLTNQSATPLVDVRVFVKIVAVDEERVVGVLPVSLTLPVAPGTEVPFSVQWDVPPTQNTGSYAAEAIVYLGDRYASVGSFDAELLGSPYAFTVVGEVVNDVSLALSDISVNGVSEVQGSSYVAPEDGPVTVSVPVVNDSKDPIKSKVTWTVYAWSGPRADRTLPAIVSDIKAHPESTGVTTFTIPDTESGAYFIDGVIEMGGTKVHTYFSLVRPARSAELIASGIGVSLADEGRAAYACILSPDVPSDNMTLTLATHWSLFGFNIPGDSAQFIGSVPSDRAFALAAALPSGASGSVVATLYRGGEVIDRAEVPYGGVNPLLAWWPVLLGGVVVLLILVALAIYARRGKVASKS